MIIYRYAVIPEATVLAAVYASMDSAMIRKDDKAKAAKTPGVEHVQTLLADGYRWVRTDDDLAIFEKATESGGNGVAEMIESLG